MSVPLPRKLARQLAGRCCYGACEDSALDGSDFCAPHDAHERGRKRSRARRRRLRLAEQGVCIVAGCGRRVGKQRGPSGGVVLRRCPACKKAHRKEQRDRRGVAVDSCGVAVDAPLPSSHWKTETYSDGSTRTRYVGRASRGGLSREVMDADLVRLLTEARALLDGFLVHFPSDRPNLDRLPRVQRTEAWELLASRLTRAARLQLEVAAALAPTWRETCAGCGRVHEEHDDA